MSFASHLFSPLFRPFIRLICTTLFYPSYNSRYLASSMPITTKPIHVFVNIDSRISILPSARLESFGNWITTEIQHIIGIDRYLVYYLSNKELATDIWQQGTALLIIFFDSSLYQDENEYLLKADEAVKKFINNNGKTIVLMVNPFFSDDNPSVEENYTITEEMKNKIKVKLQSKLDLSNELVTPVSFTEAYFFSRDDNKIDHRLIETINKDESSFVFFLTKDQFKTQEFRQDKKQPIILDTPSYSRLSFPCFDIEKYFSALETHRFGHQLIYSEITTSTMKIIEPFYEQDGFLVVASQQTEGVGRGNNKWISPKGCATFSFICHVSLSSYLSQRLSFIQHIVSLACVKCILGMPGYSDLGSVLYSSSI